MYDIPIHPPDRTCRYSYRTFYVYNLEHTFYNINNVVYIILHNELHYVNMNCRNSNYILCIGWSCVTNEKGSHVNISRFSCKSVSSFNNKRSAHSKCVEANTFQTGVTFGGMLGYAVHQEQSSGQGLVLLFTS